MVTAARGTGAHPSLSLSAAEQAAVAAELAGLSARVAALAARLDRLHAALAASAEPAGTIQVTTPATRVSAGPAAAGVATASGAWACR